MEVIELEEIVVAVLAGANDVVMRNNRHILGHYDKENGWIADNACCSINRWSFAHEILNSGSCKKHLTKLQETNMVKIINWLLADGVTVK